MNAGDVIGYLERIDGHLQQPASLHVYGSAALMLLGEELRTSLDIDIAAPYSSADQGDFTKAAELAGIPVNPDEWYVGDHIEWIGPLRLCLGQPGQEAPVLWQGRKLTVRTSSPADLVASKLIRYDETDQSDIHFLFRQAGLSIVDVEQAVDRLPPPFRHDVLLRENLDNLRSDASLWENRT